MKTHSQLTESIDRFRQSFWNKTTLDRPPVGISSDGSNTPICYLRRKFEGTELFPQDINSGLFMTDYEYMTPERRVFTDDLMPFNTAWRAVPWLEAMCGCPVRYAHGSLKPGKCIDSADGYLKAGLTENKEWFECLKNQTEALQASVPGDCWVSPSILRGPSDILAAMRGMTGFLYDLCDHIGIVDDAASLVNKLLADILDLHFSIVPPYMGGYVHTYGYWAPEKTYVIQDDTMGMCSPKMYNDVFMKYNAEIVQSLGGCILFHLHSTGIGHWHDVLRVPGLAGLEITMEENGPPLHEMVPVFREILENSRLILFVYHFFEELPEILRQIPHEGLFVLISDKFIRSEGEFVDFMKNNWR